MKRLSTFGANWSEISALLDEALDLPASSRPAWLEDLDGDRAQHRESLRALLAHQAKVETGDFLTALPQLDGADPGPPASELAPGASVGAYRLIEEIGEGGMGTVWLAERGDGIMKRRVALKLPRIAWGNSFTARLLREREILAALEHEHIARLYDAGVDAHGRPFLAMEYVEGEPIDAYCRTHSLSTRERIALLLQVMAAVGHAHSRLIVHRDLKPGNILVTANAQVKLLDFGIAKLLEGDLTQETALTELSGRALTVDYASPEQIAAEPLGTPSDIYSLGVVAFELLAGARPYRLTRGGAAELEAAISTIEPPLASEVSCERALKGDLDAILNKALKKSPTDRYLTVDAFGRDMRRHLEGAPVEAQPDRWSYRAAKFVGRHRLQVAAGSITVLALVAGASVAFWQAHEARMQADRAVAEAATATAIQSFLQEIFRFNNGDQADPDKARATTARELLDIGAARIDTELRDAPDARFRLLGTLAEMYASMAVLDRGAELQRRRVSLARAVWGDASRQMAVALAGLANALAVLDQRTEAIASASGATAILDKLGDRGSQTRFEVDLALATLYERSDHELALAAARRAVANARSRQSTTDLVTALRWQSEIAVQLRDAALARDGAQEAIGLVQADPRQGANHMSTLFIALADAQAVLGELDAADASFRQAIAVSTERNRISPIFLHTAERQYGSFLRRNGRLEQSVEVHRPGYEWARANTGAFGVMTPTLTGEYGRALIAHGRVEEGLVVIDEALAQQARLEDAPETTNGLLMFRAQGLLEQGRLDAGRADLKRAQAFFEGAKLGTNAPLTALDRRFLVAEGRADEALRSLEAERTARGRPAMPAPNESPRAILEAARIALAARRDALAADMAKGLLTRIESDPKRAWLADVEAGAAAVLGQAWLRQGHAAAARDMLTRTLALQRGVYDPQRALAIADAQLALSRAQMLTGDRAGAAESVAAAKRIQSMQRQRVATRSPG